jgi:hypothetical protein
MSLCPPLLDVIPVRLKRPLGNCAKFNEDVLAEISHLHKEDRIAGVVLSARWSMYLGKPTLSGDQGLDLWWKGRIVRDETAAAAITSGLRATLKALAAMGVRSFVIAPTPEQPFRVPACLERRNLFACSVPRAIAEENRSSALGALEKAIKRAINVDLWDPFPVLCDAEHCLVRRGETILYRDDHHLTYAGSRWLGTEFAKSTPWRELAKVKEQVGQP